MSRVFLVSANVLEEPYAVYPLGMAVNAAALAARGHEVFQYDCLAKGDLGVGHALEQFDPDLVGISVRNIDNVDSTSGDSGWCLERVRTLVAELRKYSSVPLVMGGPAFSLMPELILEYCGADYGVVGEGEKIFPELVEKICSGQKVPNISRSSRIRLDGDFFGRPLFTSELSDFYIEKSGLVGIQTKRGCPFKCVYCTYPALEGRNLRCRPVKDVVDDLQRAAGEFGVQSVFFTDSVFNDSQGNYLELAEEMVSRNTGVRWSAFFRPARITKDELKLLKRSGLQAVELGTDGASDKALEGLGKGFEWDDVLDFSEKCAGLKIPVAHFVIFGGPGEDQVSVSEGLNNLAALPPGVVFAYLGIRILPGSAMQSIAEAQNILSPDASLLRPTYYFSPGIDRETVHAQIKASFQGKRDRIYPPSEGQARMEVMQRFGFKGVLWDRLVDFKKR